MARSFEEFATQLRSLANELPERVNRRKVTIASGIHTDLVQITRVDTGEAMSNWIINPNDPSDEVRPPFVPTKKGYSQKHGMFRDYTHQQDPEATRQANITPARAQAEAELQAVKPGDSIHITNNVEHIMQLNDGAPGIDAQNFPDRAQLIARKLASGFTILQD